MNVNELRNKCRTCRYLSLSEGNWFSGYCWQCDKPVYLSSLRDFPKNYDPTCQIINNDNESAWLPLTMLAPYFKMTDA